MRREVSRRVDSGKSGSTRPIIDASVVTWRGEDRVDLKIDKKLVTVARDAGGTWKLLPRARAPAKSKAAEAGKPGAPK